MLLSLLKAFVCRLFPSEEISWSAVVIVIVLFHTCIFIVTITWDIQELNKFAFPERSFQDTSIIDKSPFL